MTKSTKQDYINYRLKSSKETLEAARILAKKEHWNSAINRLYYSCFYAISALLYKYNINANSHAGLKHQFTLHFIKTEVIDKELGKVFIELFDWRQKGDYNDFYDFDKEKTMPYCRAVSTNISVCDNYVLAPTFNMSVNKLTILPSIRTCPSHNL